MDVVLNLLKEFLDWVLQFLPTSPFVSFISAMESIPYLGWLNWFIPVGSIIVIGEAWLVSVGLFYLYSIVLRWVKAIE